MKANGHGRRDEKSCLLLTSTLDELMRSNETRKEKATGWSCQNKRFECLVGKRKSVHS